MFYCIFPLCILAKSKSVVKLDLKVASQIQEAFQFESARNVWILKYAKLTYCLDPQAIKHVDQILSGYVPRGTFCIRATT